VFFPYVELWKINTSQAATREEAYPIGVHMYLVPSLWHEEHHPTVNTSASVSTFLKTIKDICFAPLPFHPYTQTEGVENGTLGSIEKSILGVEINIVSRIKQ